MSFHFNPSTYVSNVSCVDLELAILILKVLETFISK